uniref:HYDIN/VesB/CFA65-like Ig-like domain-containing protein n=1 Tax=Catharus ustulatus TaxID=91951 RepID=A0A8C3UHV0_CATUS
IQKCMFAVSVYPKGISSSPARLHRQQEPLESQDWLLILEPHWIQVHPCELRACTSTAASALEKGSRKDVTRAQTGLLSSCFHKRQNLHFISFLQFNRLVKISMARSPYFELACPNEAYHIIPPGTSSPVRIRFTPHKNQDYSHELICITGMERIVVPIRAIGTQATLEIPDQLDFSKCPVKYSTQKTLMVYNDCNLETQYHLYTESPFSVDPDTGTLGAGDTMEVTVEFHPRKVGDHSDILEVYRVIGECWALHGAQDNVDVVLSTNSLKFGKTFITTSNYKIMLIENRSNITAHFQWKAFLTEEEEYKERRRLEENIEKKDYGEDNTAILSHMVQEETAKVQEDPMLFSDDVFSIEPMEGEIGPNCSAEVKVTFKPLEALEYQCVAYCNISGRESRLPLHLTAQGQGPLVELSYNTLDLGDILVDTCHISEVKLINRGAIDASFRYIPSTKNLGYCFKFVPEEGIIAPGRIQTIQISFNATTVGTFEEEFQFRVAGSPTPAILTIKGCVCAATVHFNINELDFGNVSFGFPCTRKCHLINASPGSLTFNIRISQDGRQPAVSSFDQIHKHNDPSWRDGIHFYLEPREFTVNPSQGTILPHGYQDIEVTLCANTMMTFYRRLLVDLEGYGNEVTSLTVTARYQQLPCSPEPSGAHPVAGGVSCPPRLGQTAEFSGSPSAMGEKGVIFTETLVVCSSSLGEH